MNYISLFSGIGGLENETISPIIVCDKDEQCLRYLSEKYPDALAVDDIRKLSCGEIKTPKVDIVTGGWPCQDISVGGKKEGLNCPRYYLERVVH